MLPPCTRSSPRWPTRRSAVGPDSVAVDTVYATTLVPVGYLGRATLVLGLPQWTALDDDERIATLAHELACGSPRAARAASWSGSPTTCSPGWCCCCHRGAWSSRTRRRASSTTAGWVRSGPATSWPVTGCAARSPPRSGAAGLTVVAAPARALQRVLRRAGAARRHRGLPGRGPPRGRARGLTHGRRHCCSARCRCRGRGWRPRSRRGDGPTRSWPWPRPSDRGPTSWPDGSRPRRRSGERAGARPRPDGGARGRSERGDVVRHPWRGPAAVRAADHDLDAYRRRLGPRFAEELVHGRP